jgi:2-haloacid dehalogenase
MNVGRREFIHMLSATAVATSQPPMSSATVRPSRIRAVAVDGFVVFDPRPVAKHVEEIFPGKGTDFVGLWRSRVFEYTWLRTLGNQYKDFWQITADALDYTAASMKLELPNLQRQQLMEMYRALPPWPDVAETLAELRRRSVRIAFLANFSAAMLDVNVAAARLGEYFEPHLTTDLVHAFKPSPRAYQMGPDAFGLDRRKIAFAAFGAWDAAGAKWFGYPTVWVNRVDATIEELDTRPDAIVSDFRGVLGFLDAHR